MGNTKMKNIILTEYCCGDPEDCDKPCVRFGSGYTRGDAFQGGKDGDERFNGNYVQYQQRYTSSEETNL